MYSEHFAPGGMYYSMNNSILRANADVAERRRRNWANEDAMRQAGMAKENALLDMLRANTDLVRAKAARSATPPPDFFGGDQLAYAEPKFGAWEPAVSDALLRSGAAPAGINQNVLAQILRGAR